MYELLLAVHLLAAVVWVGGTVALTVLASRISPADRLAVAPQFAWYGERVITGAAVVLLIAGFLLVNELDSVQIGDLWIILALIGYFASFAIGAGFLGPAGKRIATLGEAGDLAGVESTYQKLLTFSRIDTVIVLLVVIDMAVKPGG
jgi:putative copper export protein